MNYRLCELIAKFSLTAGILDDKMMALKAPELSYAPTAVLFRSKNSGVQARFWLHIALWLHGSESPRCQNK